MQKVNLKKIKILTISFLFSLTCLSAFGQNNMNLASADSLFKDKKYTQSFEIYESLLKNKISTPAMLLKMAYISEALDQPAEALFYINLYYLKTGNEKALTKMETLAESNQFQGYQSTDADFFLSLYYRYFNLTAWVLIAFAAATMALIAYQKFKNSNNPYSSGIAFLIIMSTLFYHVNFGQQYDWGILIDNNIPAMNGPSAGSEITEFLSAGHKVKVLNKDDVWTKIKWENQELYIKNNHLEEIQIYF